MSAAEDMAAEDVQEGALHGAKVVHNSSSQVITVFTQVKAATNVCVTMCGCRHGNW
jgi:hypothetical protein